VPVEVTSSRFSRFGIFRNLGRRLRIRANRFVFRNRTNSPYLSGDSFAELVDYIAFGKSGVKSISPELLNTAKSIFVRGDHLDYLLSNYGDLIHARVIISGNSDRNFIHKVILPDSVKLFLCQNATGNIDERTRTLPIGLENLRLGRTGQPKYHFYLRTRNFESKVLIPPMSPTNIVRRRVITEAQSLPEIFHVSSEFLMEVDYFKLVRKYRFVLCCEGNGFDTHRLWETLYQGSFPVLLRTEWSRTLEYLALPILFVDNLLEINNHLLNSFLSQHNNFNPQEMEVLWMPYWKNYINSFL